VTIWTGTAPTFTAGVNTGNVTRLNDLRDMAKAASEAFTTYTPTWTTSAGSPAIGNGTLTGKYARVGKLVDFRIELVVGTTTTFGTAGATWRFALPVTPVSTQRHRFSDATAYNNGVADYPVAFRWITGGPYLEVVCHATTAGNPDRIVTDTVPFTWGSTDVLMVQGRYEGA
jgi:hypothetical protein